jgi:hypothetical protein
MSKRLGDNASGQAKQKLVLFSRNRGVAQLVARPLWEREVIGSNPVTPTYKGSQKFNMRVWCSGST